MTIINYKEMYTSLILLCCKMYRFTLFVICLLGYSCLAVAQHACDNASVSVQTVCFQGDVAVGTQTELGETFTWFKEGKGRVKGPLSGNGSAISYNFRISSPQDSGIYFIEKYVAGQPVACANKIRAITIALPLPQTLSGGGYACAGGSRDLVIENTQLNVDYNVYRNNTYYGYFPGTGSSIQFNAPGGTYRVEAYNSGNCSGYSTNFGNETVQPIPESLQLMSSSGTTIVVNWPGTGNYIIEYGMSGFTPGTGSTAGGGTIINAGTSQVTLNGLLPGTSYDIYVRVSCGSGNFSDNVLNNFSTDCNTVATFPFTEGFESATVPPVLPACWISIEQDGNIYTGASVSSGVSHNGSRSVYIPSGGDALLLPKFNLLSPPKRLRYFVKSGAYYPAIYQLRLSTGNNNISSFTQLLRKDTVSAGFEEKTINLSSFSGNVYLSISSISGGIYLDDFVIENIPACAGASNVKSSNISSTGADLSWQGSGNFVVEYGAAGFTPGTAATAGTGGTVINVSSATATIAGLLPVTNYDVYVRQNCTSSSNGFSANSSKYSFITFLNCATAITIAACSNTTASSTAGNGLFDFNGFYPNNSCGKPSPGKELLYSFTPSVSGVYYLEVISSTGTPSHLYKAASTGCNNNSWIGIHSAETGGTVGKYAMGYLSSGNQYYVLFDNEYATAYSQTFKICLATVATGTCNSASFANEVLPFSTKKEYLLDGTGKLVAELDFSQVTTTARLGDASYGLTLNNYRDVTGNVSRDYNNKEYLDRAFTINSYDSIKGSLGVKLFFPNIELTRLINEPDDNIADVSSIAGLNLSVVSGGNSNYCTTLSGTGSVVFQSGNGIYDVNASYTSYVHPVNGKQFSYFFHGGSSPLTSDTSTHYGDTLLVVCPVSFATFYTQNFGVGYTYQWQLNTGTGFSGISNDTVYNGCQTNTLNISQPLTSFYGYKYRCVATNGANTIYSVNKTLKFSMTWTGEHDDEWRNPGNWYQCGYYQMYSTPDANTDIIVPAGFGSPVIRADAACRKITIQNNATIDLQPGVKLTVTGK